MKPFGYPVTILNTLDHLGKFDGKADEGFLVRYSINSKAFRVFNSRTRKVEENMHVNFLENIPNVVGIRPEWLFDIDSLTNSMNYQPVSAGNRTNGYAGSETNSDVGQAGKEKVSEEVESSPNDDDGKKATEQPACDEGGKTDDLESLDQHVKIGDDAEHINSTNSINTASPTVNVAGNEVGNFHSTNDELVSSTPITVNAASLSFGHPDALEEIGIFDDAYDNRDKGAEADYNNLETEELLQFKLLNVWTLVDLPYSKKVIGTKWVFRNKKDQRGIVVRNKAKLMDVKSAILYGTIEEEVYVSQPPEPDDIIFRSTKKSLSTEFEQLVHKRFQMSFMGELTFFLGLQVEQRKDGIFLISNPMETHKPLSKDADGIDIDVHLYRSMIGSLMYLTSSRPNIMFDVYACSRFQVQPKASHMQAVKRIFRYFKSQPTLCLWYPKDSPMDLTAYSDSDYAGTSLDRKSTTGEYIAASNCCGQVLWLQNQLLDYGYNFMHTKIHVDNESVICVVKNPVYHSKTKHIEIRHHFIRDSYEKKLIEMVKIHTDYNVADLLTKAFDVTRFQFLIASIAMVGDEAVHKELGDRMERAATTTSSLEVEQDSDAQTWFETASIKSNDPPLSRVNTLGSGEDSMKLMELMAHCTKLSDYVRKRIERCDFYDKYNMVAFLEKLEGSDGFHQIVDFLNSTHIKYALTESLIIYVSLINQFWETASTSTSENGEIEITTTIDGRVKTITEASIRRHLKLEDSVGINILPNAKIFEQLALMGYGLIDQGEGSTIPVESHHTPTSAPSTSQPPTSTPSIQTSHGAEEPATMPYDSSHPRVQSFGSDEGSLTLNELTILCTTLSKKVEDLQSDLQQTKLTYGAAYTKLIMRVKKLEHKGRIITEIDQNPSISLVQDEGTSWMQEDAEIQGRTSADTEILLDQKEPTELVEDLGSGEKARQEQEKSDLEKALDLQKQLDERKEVVAKADPAHVIDWSDPTVLRYHALQNRSFFVAEVRKNMCMYLKNQGGYKQSHFKGMSYEDVRLIFERVWDQNHAFVPKDSEIEKEVMKRPGFDLQQKQPAKRQKIGEVSGSGEEQSAEKEVSKEELQKMLLIVPVEEVYIEALQTFADMLKKFDRDDLEKLWDLVKERFNTTELTNDKEKELWVELKRLFEPDDNDMLWKLQRYMHDPLKWRLYDTCGVHHVSTERGHDIFMLVEKDYPLTKALMTVMLCNKLQVEEYSEMANELLSKIFNQLERQ
ncbi:hypothetical protein Tco_0126869 [Tanacetum coccineum]